MNILAVIPAKGKSNRLYNKNLKKIGDKTLIELAIEYAKSSSRVTEVVVSTDSVDVKKLIENLKLCKCILRGEKLSGDTDVFYVYQHAWEEMEKKADYVIGLQPDNPDRTLLLDSALDYFFDKNLDNFFTVGKDGKKNGALRIYRPKVEKFTKESTLLDDCTNIHTEDDFNIAKSRILINSNPLNLGPN